MCLAIPAKVVSIEADDVAVAAVEGVRKQISVALLDEVSVGDYVLVHVGYALHRLSEEEADRTLALMAESGVLNEELDDYRIVPFEKVKTWPGGTGRALGDFLREKGYDPAEISFS